ncbi:heme-binding protein [Anatilimnocola sp. NA78]|uniref:GlcG/HbpS family heme-binding protein n=1 Tax=Anatilimnocola sp. NA78 TaxID=3415683 RepID=UPI003CE4A5A4
MCSSLRLAFACLSLWMLAASVSPLVAQTKSGEALVTSGHFKLTLAGAEKILAAAKVKAEELKLKVNIAVADDGGHLIAFNRMDGARPASLYTAITKATASATLRAPTGPLPPGVKELDVWLNLSVQIAAGQSGGKFTTLKGGVPVIVDGQVIGAVGVGGGTGEHDAEIATAGIEALLKELK